MFHKRFLISICIFISAAIICGAVEIFLFHIPFLNCITELFCIGFVIFWINSIKRRIVETNTRRLLLGCGYLLLLYFVFQIFRYRFIKINITWYIYYIPMVLVPLLAFYIAYDIYGKHLERRKVAYPLAAVPSVVILLLILTNDWHQLAFVINTPEDYSYGPVYFVHIAWSLILLAGILYFSIKGFIFSYDRKFGLILIIPVATELVYTVLYIIGNNPEIGGIHVWSTATVFAICCIGILEMCIQMGLISSNSGYEKIYEAIQAPSAIYEKSGKLKYVSGSFSQINPEDENYHFLEENISGGTVKAAVNISEIKKLNGEIALVSSQMQSRNEHLFFENRTRTEKTEIEERNKIYDKIAQAVKPQLETIQELLKSDLDENIRQIAVLYAYIKRRSNMELIAEKDILPTSELYNALLECGEYIKLTGVRILLTCIGEAEFSSEIIIGLFEWLENVVEDCIKEASALAIRITTNDDAIQIRLMISAENLQIPPIPSESVLSKYVKENLIVKEGDDLIISLCLGSGGEK